MQALLIATGETQKLKPLTERVPSPMLSIMNRPIMLYNLELLGRLGIKRILVSVYHLASSIEQYFGDGQRWGLSLEYILQREPLGSAGILRRAKRLLNEPFLVMQADEIADLEITGAICNHTDQNAQATVIVQPGSRAGNRTLITGDTGQVLSVGNGHTGSKFAWTNTGTYIFDPRILDRVPRHQPADLHQHLLPFLLSEGIQINTCPVLGYWNPLDTLQQYAEAQHVFLSKALKGEAPSDGKVTYRYHSLETRQIARGIWAGRNVNIQPDVKMIPPVSIGHGTWIDRQVELGPSVVIGSNVVIDQEATIQHSIVLDNTYIGKLVNINNRLVNQDQLIDLVTNDHVRVKSPILLGKTNTKSIAFALKRFCDCFVALVLLLICSPLTLVLGALLLLSGGRIFNLIPCWSQRAFNTRGDPIGDAGAFNLLHFNKQRKDGSVTRVGRWLERWEGERLPELLNVLKGDLGMVGLKPAVTALERKLQAELLAEQEGVPAGFTGLWYVQTDEGCSFEEILVADAFYIATRSWKSDWRILWSTPAAWYQRIRRRYGTD